MLCAAVTTQPSCQQRKDVMPPPSPPTGEVCNCACAKAKYLQAESKLDYAHDMMDGLLDSQESQARGAFTNIPSCDELSGDWKPIQCRSRLGANGDPCFCVWTDTGEEIPGTRSSTRELDVCLRATRARVGESCDLLPIHDAAGVPIHGMGHGGCATDGVERVDVMTTKGCQRCATGAVCGRTFRADVPGKGVCVIMSTFTAPQKHLLDKALNERFLVIPGSTIADLVAACSADDLSTLCKYDLLTTVPTKVEAGTNMLNSKFCSSMCYRLWSHRFIQYCGRSSKPDAQVAVKELQAEVLKCTTDPGTDHDDGVTSGNK